MRDISPGMIASRLNAFAMAIREVAAAGFAATNELRILTVTICRTHCPPEPKGPRWLQHRRRKAARKAS